MSKLSRFYPFIWGSLILVLAEAFTFYIVSRQKAFVEEHRIVTPEVSLAFPLVYFFVVVAVLGAVLFFIPLSKLRIVLKVTFGFLFAWGTFIALGLVLTVLPAAVISIAAGVLWLFSPRVWLHDLLLMLAVVSAGSVFGFILALWSAVALMLIISVYDVVAVRFGYMMWMAKKLSESETLPAFVMPKKLRDWNLDLRASGFKELTKDTGEREFSILGGGDIGFPLLLMVSVFLKHGAAAFVIVGGFSLLGLAGAYLIQLFWLKGKPVPALPPITLLSLVGFVIAT